jgi:phosphatidate cytidylyltransferase
MPALAKIPEVFPIFAALFLTLSAASLTGYFIHHRAPSATTVNLNARIRAWWVMIAISALTLALGPKAITALFALMSFLCLREFITQTPVRQGDHSALFVCFFLALPIQYVLVSANWYGLFAIFIPVYAFLALPVLAVLFRDTQRFLDRSAALHWGLMICVYCLSHIPALLNLRIPNFEDRGALLVVFLVLVVQSSDVFQYLWGRLLGKHKVASTLSPNKTVEGLAGGLASSTMLGGALYWITPFTPLQAAAISLLITSLGFCGGLVLSAIKRDRGIKDWGGWISGHGGILDRLDSLCWAAPVFFHLTRYWFDRS